MKKKTLNKRKVDNEFVNTSYDDMKNFINLSRVLNEQKETEEVDFESAQEEAIEDASEEKTKEYTVSGGKIITHGVTDEDLELTDEEKSVYQETMDGFVEQVSDMAEFHPLNIYKTNVEWSGELLKFDVRFYYSIAEVDGVYIGNANMVKINPEFLELLQSLKSYYGIFESKWAQTLASRRKTESETEEVTGDEVDDPYNA